MRIKPGLKLRQIDNDYLVVDPDKDNIDFTHIYQMSDAAAYLWETFCEKDFTVEMMKNALCEAYDVEPEVAVRDVEDMLGQWEAFGLLTK